MVISVPPPANVILTGDLALEITLFDSFQLIFFAVIILIKFLDLDSTGITLILVSNNFNIFSLVSSPSVRYVKSLFIILIIEVLRVCLLNNALLISPSVTSPTIFF